MSELYLIAHSVRGEAALDVASQMECPLCVTSDYHSQEGCLECDHLGYWWIIPTSGHRAYPYWYVNINDMSENGVVTYSIGTDKSVVYLNPPVIPSRWPDHYKTKASPKLDITSLFKAAPKAHIARRL